MPSTGIAGLGSNRGGRARRIGAEGAVEFAGIVGFWIRGVSPGRGRLPGKLRITGLVKVFTGMLTLPVQWSV